ncbi:hypothetical protein QTI17_33665 [Variovorax sp. J31P179]|uniref:hypothetical protein n=1 Tax=Variovorax sp. J31P179 TaxID=3053508 RepID=UPI0025768C40|nr:hypothetical protein [Variovorax sp. J31P179]MDM0085549.1 hypothetical protein [Variovorax sp. J31P179]
MVATQFIQNPALLDAPAQHAVVVDDRLHAIDQRRIEIAEAGRGLRACAPSSAVPLKDAEAVAVL